jgi:hypothetical protein
LNRSWWGLSYTAFLGLKSAYFRTECSGNKALKAVPCAMTAPI